jgi:hypothetical protein
MKEPRKALRSTPRGVPLGISMIGTLETVFFSLASSRAMSRTATVDATLIQSQGGPYHGNEIKAKSGAGWLALYQTENGFELRKVSLDVSTVHDPVLDSQPEQRTGKFITVTPESQQKSIVLIKPQSTIVLAEGKVEGTLYDSGTTVYPGQSKMVKLEQKYYFLAGTGEATIEAGSSEPPIKNYGLHLFFQQQSQLLFSEKGSLGSDGRPQIIWAGDLDRDGKLDLLLNLTTHYNSTRLALFLSSVAKGSSLVEMVAELSTTGC